MHRQIYLLSERPNVDPSDLLALHDGPIIACDCYVVGAEHWLAVPGGYSSGRIVNVDHHAPTAAMARRISSANLALERVRAIGLPSNDTAIFVTHADCDSILSAGILSGTLATDDRYGDAALAADHTGDPNAIADLLQSLDRRRDLAFSFAALAALEAGRPLPGDAQLDLNAQYRKRDAAAACVREGKVHLQGPIAIVELDESLDGAYFTPLLPDAVVILLSIPHEVHTSRLEMKLRLGNAAPSGFSLHDLDIRRFDPAYGGRWNAGSNRRSGGSPLPLQEYAAFLEEQVNCMLLRARHKT